MVQVTDLVIDPPRDNCATMKINGASSIVSSIQNHYGCRSHLVRLTNPTTDLRQVHFFLSGGEVRRRFARVTRWFHHQWTLTSKPRTLKNLLRNTNSSCFSTQIYNFSQKFTRIQFKNQHFSKFWNDSRLKMYGSGNDLQHCWVNVLWKFPEFLSTLPVAPSDGQTHN